MKIIKWTKEEEEILKNHYPTGGKIICSKLLSRSYGAIMHRAHLMGISAPSQDFFISKEEADKIFYLIKYEGKSFNDLAKSYNMAPATLSKVVKKYYPNQKFRRLSCYGNVDHTYFDKIGPDQAYFIGLILSDGCIRKNGTGQSRITIQLQIGDKHILDDLAKEISLKTQIVTYDKKKINCKPMCTLSISSDQIANKLNELGIGPNKSRTVQIPKLFLENKDLFWHFFRGVMDGDGTIGHDGGRKCNRKQYRFGLYGNCFVCGVLAKHLSENYSLGSGKIFFDNKSSYAFQIGGNRQIKKLYSLLYKDAKFFLTRKHNKFLECFAQDNLEPPFILTDTLQEFQMKSVIDPISTPNFQPS